MLTLVVYSCLTGAYDCAFYAESNSDMSWVEILVDISFYLDIFLNFYTGYDNGHEIITDKKEIAKNYVRGWFFLDLLATIEWDIVIGWFADDANDYRSARLPIHAPHTALPLRSFSSRFTHSIRCARA